jgi:16S rRNA processing protein RimM
MAKQSAMADNLVLVGRIGAAHGIRGEVRLQSFTGDPLAIAGYGPLATDRAGLDAISIAAARPAGNVLIARLNDVADRSAAEKLNGVGLYLDREKLPAVEDDDDFYQADLIGLEARLETGEPLGDVIAVPNFGAGDLIEVRDAASGRTELYPFTKAVVPVVKVAEGYLIIVPPDETEGEPPPDGEAQ